MELADGGAVRTKKVGARGRIWWPPAGDGGGDAVAADSDDVDSGADDVADVGGGNDVAGDDGERRRETHRRFPDIATHAGEIVWTTDAGLSELLYINPAYEEIYGRPREEMYADPTAGAGALAPPFADRRVSIDRRTRSSRARAANART